MSYFYQIVMQDSSWRSKLPRFCFGVRYLRGMDLRLLSSLLGLLYVLDCLRTAWSLLRQMAVDKRGMDQCSSSCKWSACGWRCSRRVPRWPVRKDEREAARWHVQVLPEFYPQPKWWGQVFQVVSYINFFILQLCLANLVRSKTAITFNLPVQY